MSRSKATLEGMVGSIHNSLKASDPKVEFAIITKSPEAIHYHWKTHATDANPAQHEIAKIMKGQKDFYRVAYVKKTNQLSEAEFSKWSRVIGDAKLVAMKNGAAKSVSSNKSDLRLDAWELGKSLSFAALLRGKHGPDDAVKKTLLSVSKHAQALTVAVPPPSKLTDDAAADTSAAIHFLLDTAGKPIYNSLQKNHGDAHSALFELAPNQPCFQCCISQETQLVNHFLKPSKNRQQKAKLVDSIWKPLTDKVRNKATGE